MQVKCLTKDTKNGVSMQGVEPVTFEFEIRCSTHYIATKPPITVHTYSTHFTNNKGHKL